MKKVRTRIFPFFIALPIIVVLVGAFIRNQLNMSWIYDALGKLGILGYYGTIFGIYWAMISYNQTQEKEREKEKKEQEEKWKQENENREKKYKKEEKARKEDLENYKNSFRPMFALNDEGNKLIVLLGRDDLYIEKVRYYATDEDQGVFYRSLKNNSEIKIEHPKDFFVTAETLIGETILFGIVLGGIKVYMALREGGQFVAPADERGSTSDLYEEIYANWISYNRGGLNKEVSNTTNLGILEKTDIYFMSRTHGIREKMGFSLSEHIKGVLEAKNIKEILENAMDLNSTYKDQFDQETQKQIAKCIMEFLEKWPISINIQKIDQGRWEYLTKKTGVSQYKGSIQCLLYFLIKHYSNDGINVDNMVAVYSQIEDLVEFPGELERETEQFRGAILEIISK